MVAEGRDGVHAPTRGRRSDGRATSDTEARLNSGADGNDDAERSRGEEEGVGWVRM